MGPTPSTIDLGSTYLVGIQMTGDAVTGNDNLIRIDSFTTDATATDQD